MLVLRADAVDGRDARQQVPHAPRRAHLLDGRDGLLLFAGVHRPGKAPAAGAAQQEDPGGQPREHHQQLVREKNIFPSMNYPFQINFPTMSECNK